MRNDWRIILLPIGGLLLVGTAVGVMFFTPDAKIYVDNLGGAEELTVRCGEETVAVGPGQVAALWLFRGEKNVTVSSRGEQVRQTEFTIPESYFGYRQYIFDPSGERRYVRVRIQYFTEDEPPPQQTDQELLALLEPLAPNELIDVTWVRYVLEPHPDEIKMEGSAETRTRASVIHPFLHFILSQVKNGEGEVDEGYVGYIYGNLLDDRDGQRWSVTFDQEFRESLEAEDEAAPEEAAADGA